ncbi:hypothetical protein Tco_0273873 [Tanacetum coccineum]
MLIALENAKKEQENQEEDQNDKKDKKKKKKTSKFLTMGDILKYDQEWWELYDLIPLVNPNNVIPINLLQTIFEMNMPVCDPSIGVEWSPAKKKAWKEKISSTVKAYENFTKRICEPLFPAGIEVSRAGEGDAFQRGGWHYWQIPSGENAAGAKLGRPASGEHMEEKEPGRWKSQGRPGHLTEMEGFGL